MTHPISYREFLHREYHIPHAPYEPEINYYTLVAHGNVKEITELSQEALSQKKGLGILSDNALQNLRYHFVISVAAIARACIENGLPLSESYNMSDYYIQLMDKATTCAEIDALHSQMSIAYTKRMYLLQKETICSKPIAICLDYIYEHLNSRIKLEELCRATSLSSSYLSRIFKQETGYTISRYILMKKLETAQNMLLYSEYSIADISASLSFPCQSYFTNVFKKEFQMTPNQYRHNH